MTTPSNVLDPELYEKARKIVYKQYPQHSAYRSGQLVQKYKDLGGRYSGKKTTKGLTRWYKEKWENIGKDDQYPTYRPTRRVSAETPLTASEIDPMQAKKQIALKQKIKGDSNLPAFKGGGILDTIRNMIRRDTRVSGETAPAPRPVARPRTPEEQMSREGLIKLRMTMPVEGRVLPRNYFGTNEDSIRMGREDTLRSAKKREKERQNYERVLMEENDTSVYGDTQRKERRMDYIKQRLKENADDDRLYKERMEFNTPADFYEYQPTRFL